MSTCVNHMFHVSITYLFASTNSDLYLKKVNESATLRKKLLTLLNWYIYISHIYIMSERKHVSGLYIH